MSIRWSDNDRYFGPFTYCGSDYKRYAFMLGSGSDEYPHCRLRMQIGRKTLLIKLPQWVLQPHRIKVMCPSWDAATVARLGRDWYWDVYEREFGFCYSEKALHIHYGPQTHSSCTTKNKVFFIPWLSWRHVRTSHYGLQGEHYHTEPKGAKWDSPAYEKSRAVVDDCPTASFSFIDFDGEHINAKTTIQEREWRLGEGYFKWLSIFRKPKITRSLNINFSSEVGRKKGSWKGGTVGHGIDMDHTETHEQAFRRYCEKYELIFTGAIT